MRTLRNLFWFLLGLAIVALALPAFAADIKDWPEANPWTAFNAKEEQRIWHKPGNLVMEAKSWPIVRATMTMFDDKHSDGEPTGFLTLTHANPADGKTITFYFNVKIDLEVMAEQPASVLSFTTDGGMWEEGFADIAPAIRSPSEFFSALPESAQMLWMLPPLEGHITKDKEERYLLQFIQGGPGLNGLVTLPLLNLQSFKTVQKARSLRVWGAEIGTPSSIKWTTGGLNGRYEWQPGWEKPILRHDGEKEI